MNSVSLSIALLLASGIRISTPLILGALGETVTERAGHLNLGVEGMMMLGGALAYTVALHTESVILALLGGMLGAMFGSLVYAFLTVALRANQTVTGLALTTFGVGLGNTIGKLGNGANVPSAVTQFFGKGPLTLNLDGIENKPVLGPVLTFINEAILKHNIFVYLAIILAIILYIFLFKTRAGLHLRAVGEVRRRQMPQVSTSIE